MEDTHVQNQAGGKKNSTRSAAMLGLVLMLVIFLVGMFYLLVTQNQVYTDKAGIEADVVNIAAAQGGVLEKILVKTGDRVEAGTVVAQVGNQILKTKEAGLIINTSESTGKTMIGNDPVVSLIDPNDLRVVAHIDEDKGLSSIKVGQQVVFTVDTFGGKKYDGVVAEISQSSRQSGVVFNISDQREVKQFDVKIRFDESSYSELKNGMSAKVTIYTK